VGSATRPSRSTPDRPRLLIALHAFYGAAMLVAPQALCHDAPDPALARALARVLGARHLGEALLLGSRTNPDWIALSASLDGLHGASMLLLAWRHPRWRKLATASAAGAGALCAFSVCCYSQRS
jgi:hypothetical protein